MKQTKYIKKEISYPNEIYKCTTCNNEYNKEDVELNWQCPECDEYILIESYDEETSDITIFIRKRADQLKKGNYIHYYGEMYQVVGVTILDDKKLGKIWIGLKGFTRIEVDVNECVNCVP
ncbi:hypothetical protein [Citrobacter sp. Cu096]|uniref:hypothetical protein n=1 Tax=Citrobacter sp. Cu096 TaxID=2985158 RepID=UPI00257565FE|nr:hypothetical protein [Citrobacter sp. Cu096]MDM2740943.1 hypothetical protein [Citrobacter sp. Cu096]